MPDSSQLRFAMVYILITAVVLFFLNIYTSRSLRGMIFDAHQQSLQSKAQLMATALLQLDELSAQKAEQTVNSMDDLTTTRTVIADAGGTAIYDSVGAGSGVGKLLLFPEIVTALSGKDVFFCRYIDDAIESRAAIPLVKNGNTLGVVYLMEYDTDQGALISALQANVLRISAALEFLVVVVSLGFSTAFSRRLRRILHSVRMMRDGDYNHKIKLRGHTELDQLGREFNNLAERLDNSEQQRRQFVSDASHELKTPLASIKLLADSILQNKMDIETQNEFISDIGREADRLGRLSQKLLMLTRLDSKLDEEREIVNAAKTVEKVTRMLQPLAELRNISISCSLTECHIVTVEDDLYQIAFNLVENAIKYNRDGGAVNITLCCRSGDAALTIADSGVGIPEEAIAHLFERFYRVDKARSRAAGGAGLGLSIVHDMVERNYGTIQVKSQSGVGTTFTVHFPLFEEDEA